MRHQGEFRIGKPAAAQHKHTADAVTISVAHHILGLKHVVKRTIVRKDGLRPTLANVACALVDAALHQHANLIAALIVHALHTRQPIAGPRDLQAGSANSDGDRAKCRSSQGNAGNDAGRNT